MSPTEVVRALWERMQARDWDGARATLADGFTCDYPETGESFQADGYIAMNRAYPGDWTILVDEVLAEGNRVVARIRVPLGDQLFHCLSFADVEDGRIASSTEFWLTDRAIAPPDWRAPFVAGPEREED
jgi:ketosteroid isomerase-like protein